MNCDRESPDYNKEPCAILGKSVPPSSTSEAQPVQQVPDAVVRVGGWLFRKRTSIPLPIVVALLVVPPRVNDSLSTSLLLAGVPLVAAGELIRLWGVHHI